LGSWKNNQVFRQACTARVELLFGVTIAVLVLEESLRITRITAAALIVSGLVLIR